MRTRPRPPHGPRAYRLNPSVIHLGRCGWCHRRLRFWQFHWCRQCAWLLDMGLPLNPYPPGSRRDGPPDTLLSPWLPGTGSVRAHPGAER